jgi:hypothetical protein
MLANVVFSKNFYNLCKRTTQGDTLKRREAVETLKEILESCNLINPSYVSLHPLKEADEYELHIKNQIPDSCQDQLNDIMQRRGLAMKEYGGFLLIYTP